MSSERDTTRIVRSWLEDGSTALPDRVLDSVLSGLPSTAQRRPVWSPWRHTRMTSVLRLAAVAALLIAAVIGTAILVGGGPGPAPAPVPVAGQVSFAVDGELLTIDVSAVATGSTLSGMAVLHSTVNPGQPVFTLQLECLRRLDGTTWSLGGAVGQTTVNGPPAGSRAALIVVDGPAAKAGMWFETQPPAADCATFLAHVPVDEVTNGDSVFPVRDGEISLPK